MQWSLPLWMAVATAACTSTRSGAPPVDYVPREVVEVGRYRVVHEGRALGAVVALEIRDRLGPLRFYRVESAHGAWVGHATDIGRFSRRLPFREDEQDLGIWPMAQGVARLFDVDGEVALTPVPAAVAVPASVPKSSARREP